MKVQQFGHEQCLPSKIQITAARHLSPAPHDHQSPPQNPVLHAQCVQTRLNEIGHYEEVRSAVTDLAVEPDAVHVVKS